MILNVLWYVAHSIEADILVKEASHAPKSSEDVCKTSMDGKASSIPKGVSHLLGYAIEGIGRIIGKARTEGLEQLLLNIRFEFSEEDVAVCVIFGSHVKGCIN